MPPIITKPLAVLLLLSTPCNFAAIDICNLQEFVEKETHILGTRHNTHRLRSHLISASSSWTVLCTDVQRLSEQGQFFNYYKKIKIKYMFYYIYFALIWIDEINIPNQRILFKYKQQQLLPTGLIFLLFPPLRSSFFHTPSPVTLGSVSGTPPRAAVSHIHSSSHTGLKYNHCVNIMHRNTPAPSPSEGASHISLLFWGGRLRY